MPDPIKMEPIQPVTVTVIKGTGDGGTPLQTGVTATTPDHLPNIVVTMISPLVAICIRFANTFLVSLSGLLVAAMTPAGSSLLYTSDFWHLLITCANLSIPVAGLGFIKDCATIFGKLEGKFPLATGSV